MIHKYLGHLLVVGILAAASALSSATLAQSPEFAGETINIYVGRPPGSGADLSVRAFVRFWEKHIPGEPTMVVRNMPGGGGQRVWNHGWERARPDGRNIMFSPLAGVAAIVENRGLRADFTKMPFIGALMNPNVIYVRHPDIHSVDDLMRARGIKFAGQYPSHRMDILGRLGFDLLGVDYEYVTGFRGGNEIINAVRRGEVHAHMAALSHYRNSAGPAMPDAVPLWHNPVRGPTGEFVSVEAAEGFPSFIELYREIKGEDPSGEMWEVYSWLISNVNQIAYAAFLPPGTAEGPTAILRESFMATTRDPGYLAEEIKMFGYNQLPVDAARGRAVIRQIMDAPAEIEAFLLAYTNRSD